MLGLVLRAPTTCMNDLGPRRVKVRPPNALESPAPESQIVEFMVTSVIWIVVILPVLSSI